MCVQFYSQHPEDNIVQLLEAEVSDSCRHSVCLLILPLSLPQVEALRSKVSSLEGDLRSSSTVNGQLQNQLVKERREKENSIRELEQEKEDITLQVSQKLKE